MTKNYPYKRIDGNKDNNKSNTVSKELIMQMLINKLSRIFTDISNELGKLPEGYTIDKNFDNNNEPCYIIKNENDTYEIGINKDCTMVKKIAQKEDGIETLIKFFDSFDDETYYLMEEINVTDMEGNPIDNTPREVSYKNMSKKTDCLLDETHMISDRKTGEVDLQRINYLENNQVASELNISISDDDKLNVELNILDEKQDSYRIYVYEFDSNFKCNTDLRAFQKLSEECPIAIAGLLDGRSIEGKVLHYEESYNFEKFSIDKLHKALHNKVDINGILGDPNYKKLIDAAHNNMPVLYSIVVKCDGSITHNFVLETGEEIIIGTNKSSLLPFATCGMSYYSFLNKEGYDKKTDDEIVNPFDNVFSEEVASEMTISRLLLSLIEEFGIEDEFPVTTITSLKRDGDKLFENSASYCNAFNTSYKKQSYKEFADNELIALRDVITQEDNVGKKVEYLYNDYGEKVKYRCETTESEILTEFIRLTSTEKSLFTETRQMMEDDDYSVIIKKSDHRENCILEGRTIKNGSLIEITRLTQILNKKVNLDVNTHNVIVKPIDNEKKFEETFTQIICEEMEQ